MTEGASERRETPLAARLKNQIRREGAIPVRAYMQACLQDAEYGYYRQKTAIGGAGGGDFITAPEISQVFGELLGLWAAVVWQGLGAPRAVALVELGPGRGTLMADVLRATRIVPGFHAALGVHLVETSATLAAQQRDRLRDCTVPIRWHAAVEALESALEGSDAPIVLLANEFLDACPVSQYIMTEAGVCERCVGLDANGELAFTCLPSRYALPVSLSPGEVLEVQDFGFVAGLARLSQTRPLAGLFIDYGHTTSGPGDTLQALRDHTAEHPLAAPGDADLSVQVDFAAFRSDAELAGFMSDGPVTQAELLGRLGIIERASRLMAQNAAKAAAIESGIARLLAPGGMGSRFKAIGIRKHVTASLPGL